jgi:SAM-dependent methyltransferase
MKRDVWALGPPSNGYPGAFPRGLIKRIKANGWWGQDRLWMFSGSFQDVGGTMVDARSGRVCSKCRNVEVACKCPDGPALSKVEVRPTFVADCEDLPCEDESFDFVMLDPPYSEAEAADLYDMPYCNIPKVVNEAARVCAPGGRVLMLHRLIPWAGPWENEHKKRLVPEAVIGVYTIAGYTNIRCLSVWRKNESLTPFLGDGDRQ